MTTVQIQLNAESNSIIDNLKYLLTRLQGVRDVTFTNIDSDGDITKTSAYIDSEEDIRQSKIYSTDGAKDMIKLINLMNTGHYQIPQELQQISKGVHLPDGIDYKDEVSQYLEEKYA
ncbi:MAG: hypothetical protein J6P44_05055 [Bacteroidales bacterium]|nr:hypothetical protein [Bacteroidales bacterium]